MTGVDIRPATPEDRPGVLDLLRAALGWERDARYDELFAWKHDANPFGTSPAWIAVDGGRVVGFRTFMRWEFQLDGEVVRAVRAVDTATHPDYQGRGLFRALTEHALEDLHAQAVSFVFNTPNRASLPGYLRMGWREVGRLPARVRPRSLGALARITRARVPADRWPVAGAGSAQPPAFELLRDPSLAGALLARTPGVSGPTTHRTPAYVAWRYSLASLGYRTLLYGEDPRDGLVVYRLRRRGPALELAVVDALGGEPARRPRLPIGALLRECGADYAIAIGRALPGTWSVPLARRGPVLTWRGVGSTTMPVLRQWRLTLGDIELF